MVRIVTCMGEVTGMCAVFPDTATIKEKLFECQTYWVDLSHRFFYGVNDDGMALYDCLPLNSYTCGLRTGLKRIWVKSYEMHRDTPSDITDLELTSAFTRVLHPRVLVLVYFKYDPSIWKNPDPVGPRIPITNRI